MVSFIVNVQTKSCCDIAVSLQIGNTHGCSEVFTLKDHLNGADATVSISMSGIIVDTSNYVDIPFLRVKLVSPEQLTVENSVLNIMEI